MVINPFLSPFDETKADTDAKSQTATDQDIPAAEPMNFNARIARIERQMLQDALQQNHNNQRRTATALGLSYDQLRGMVRKYKLSESSEVGTNQA